MNSVIIKDTCYPQSTDHSGGVVEITGNVIEGFKIRIRFNKSGKLLTVYPSIERIVA